jgi:hypothetical protein
MGRGMTLHRIIHEDAERSRFFQETLRTRKRCARVRREVNEPLRGTLRCPRYHEKRFIDQV